MTTLDVVIPTYNRAAMLAGAVRSLLEAPVPQGMEARVIVVDNNSKDETRRAVEGLRAEANGIAVSYVFEGRQGRSHALNAGVAAARGDLVGFIDDDEEVDPRWFAVVGEAFADAGVDFIGGPYLPRWGAAVPDWLPEDYPGVVGWIDAGCERLPYDADFPGILMGGNCVLRRAVLARVGPYLTEVGRTGERLLCGEDEDMYQRLLADGARGFYRPDLIIHHHVPPERLTKSYFRRWCFWRGVSLAALSGVRREAVAYLAGVPRYLYGRAARGAARRVSFGTPPAQKFSGELALYDLAGYFYGKHFYKHAKTSPATAANAAAAETPRAQTEGNG